MYLASNCVVKLQLPNTAQLPVLVDF